MKIDKIDERRWQLFLHILDKQNLDVKGDNIDGYKPNFYSAFNKANNIAYLYQRLSSGIEVMLKYCGEDKSDEDNEVNE